MSFTGQKKFFFLILITALFLIPLTGFAQTSRQELGISPVNFELTANPGDILENKIKIYNPNDFVMGVKMEIEDFAPVGEEGSVVVTQLENETYSLKRWTQISPQELVLEPRESKLVTFTIAVPDSAEPGGHFGSILAGVSTVAGGEFGGAGLAQKVGSLVLLTVSGALHEDLAIREFSAPAFSEYGPVDFKIRFENEGTVHVRPKGFIIITRGNLTKSEKIASIEFSQKNVLPGARRLIESQWSEKWLWGKYTATVVGNYGTGNMPITSIVTFWIFPWKIVSGGVFGFLVIIFFFLRIRKRLALAAKILLKGERHGQ